MIDKIFKFAAPPARFASPGLIRVALRLGLLSEQQVDSLRPGAGSAKLIAAAHGAGLLNEAEALQKIGEDLKLRILPSLFAFKLDRTLIEQFGVAFLNDQRCLPLAKNDHEIEMAFADPLDLEAVREAEFIAQQKIKIVLSRESEILKMLQRSKAVPERTAEEIDFVPDQDELLIASGPAEKDVLQSAPVVSLVNEILLDAAESGASDIHIEPGQQGTEIRLRIDGIMRPYRTIKRELQAYIVSRLKLLSGMDISERRKPQDGRFRIRTRSQQVRDLRVSSVPTPSGEKLVIRLLHTDFEGLNFPSLGFPDKQVEQMKELLRLHDRMIIVSGPTGSGKTTTLYAAITEIKKGATNIVTVEDPIELRIDGATQIQVDSKAGITFASGLRSILRQDPDVILVGEIRDLETAEIAFQAAQTGHLVLSTVHSNTAASTIVRLRDIGLETYIIASSLAAVLAQRLVRRLCTDCAKPIAQAEKAELCRQFGLAEAEFKQAVGCPECDGTGYRGRAGVYSLLVVDSAIRELIRSGAGEDQLEQAARKQGMRSLSEAALRLAARGITSFDEVDRAIGIERGIAPPAAPTKPKRERRPSVTDLAKHYSLTVQRADRSVMVVDDDPGVRAVIARSFTQAGFKVTEAEDGIDALKQLKGSLPDLIVCDLMMPRLSGKDLISKLQELQLTRSIPVLVLTGSDSEENEVELLELGATDFVSKSSSPQVVIARAKRMLGIK